MLSRKLKISLLSKLIAIILFFTFTGVAWAEEQGVPADILAAVKKVNEKSSRKRAPSAVTMEQSGNIKVQPGHNITVTVAGNELNAIFTPFTNPIVHRARKSSKINVDGSVVYIAIPMADGPTSIFINENGESDPSISLTLVPRENIPPRQIRLEFAGGGPVTNFSAGKSAKWEKSQPYTDAIEKVMLGTARGEVPPGYNLRNPINLDPRPRCNLPVNIEPRQVLEGHSFLVVISKLTNISSSPLQFNESACYQPGVRAVSVWPQVNLNPRQSAELYVLFGRDGVQQPGKRPSVLYQTSPAQSKRQPAKKLKSRVPQEPETDFSDQLKTPHPLSANLP